MKRSKLMSSSLSHQGQGNGHHQHQHQHSQSPQDSLFEFSKIRRRPAAAVSGKTLNCVFNNSNDACRPLNMSDLTVDIAADSKLFDLRRGSERTATSGSNASILSLERIIGANGAASAVAGSGLAQRSDNRLLRPGDKEDRSSSSASDGGGGGAGLFLGNNRHRYLPVSNRATTTTTAPAIPASSCSSSSLPVVRRRSASFDVPSAPLAATVVFVDLEGYSKSSDDHQRQLTCDFMSSVRNLLTFAYGEIPVRGKIDDYVILPTGDGAAVIVIRPPTRTLRRRDGNVGGGGRCDGDGADRRGVAGRQAPAGIDCHVCSSRSLRTTEETALWVGSSLLLWASRRRIGLRVGLNSGELSVVEDPYGDPNVCGDAINMAARIMDTALPGQILVSSSTVVPNLRDLAAGDSSAGASPSDSIGAREKGEDGKDAGDGNGGYPEPRRRPRDCAHCPWIRFEISSVPSEVVVKHGVTADVQSVRCALHPLPRPEDLPPELRRFRRRSRTLSDKALSRSHRQAKQSFASLSSFGANESQRSLEKNKGGKCGYSAPARNASWKLDNSGSLGDLGLAHRLTLISQLTLVEDSTVGSQTSENSIATMSSADVVSKAQQNHQLRRPQQLQVCEVQQPHQQQPNSGPAHRLSSLSPMSSFDDIPSTRHKSGSSHGTLHIPNATSGVQQNHQLQRKQQQRQPTVDPLPLDVGNHRVPATKWYMKIKPTLMQSSSNNEIKPKVLPQELIRRHKCIAFLGIVHDNLSRGFVKILEKDPSHRWDQVYIFFPSDACLRNHLTANYRDKSVEALISDKRECRLALSKILSSVVDDLHFLQYDQLMHCGSYWDWRDPGGFIHISPVTWGANPKTCPAMNYYWNSKVPSPEYRVYREGLEFLLGMAIPFEEAIDDDASGTDLKEAENGCGTKETNDNRLRSP